CAAIAIRLMLFRQGECQHKWSYSLLAYLLIVATGIITIQILMHQYTHVHLWEVVINSIVCISVFMARGNVAKVVGKI
ncbi:phage holin family protein, partial [Campylobacter jejuni]|nr:phage holin family protein [Campylobacter jejuni]